MADPGGGGRIGRAPPPFFSADFCFYRTIFFLFLFFACHPGGRSGRWMVALHNNVNDGKIIQGKKCIGVPPPPPTERPFQAWRGIKEFPALPFPKSWIRHWQQQHKLTILSELHYQWVKQVWKSIHSDFSMKWVPTLFFSYKKIMNDWNRCQNMAGSAAILAGKNRGSEDRDSHDRLITRDRNDRKCHLMYKH